MKADLTKPEVRAAFILQYHGQNVVPVTGPSLFAPLHIDDLPGMIVNGQNLPLSLRNFKTLSYGEQFELVKLFAFKKDFERINYYNDGCIELLYNTGHYNQETEEFEYRLEKIYVNHLMMTSIAADTLRSKGFLVDYAGNSCEALIDSGLAVYREDNKQ